MYSIRPKTNLSATSNVKLPGPGTYDVFPTITKDGRYIVSKYKSSGASNFNPPSSSRFFALDKSNN